MLQRLLFLSMLLFVFTQYSFSQAGKPDKSFGENGVAKIPVVLLHKNELVNATKIVQLKNGKFIVGVSTLLGFTFNDIYLYRINKDGTLDTSFANNGRKIIHSGTDAFSLFDVITDSGNNIIVSTGASGSNDLGFSLRRYKPGGKIDSSFGDKGVAVVNNINGKAGMLSLQPDGKILASGFQFPSYFQPLNSVLYRFTQNGLPDSSFNKHGYVLFENNFFGYYPQGFNYYYSATQPSNKIIYAGTAITQLNENGKKNKSFADSGQIIGDSTFPDEAWCKEVFSNINILGNGDFMCLSVYNIANRYDDGTVKSKVCKFKSNGTPDSSFNLNGRVMIDSTRYTSEYMPAPVVDHFIVQPDGKFILSNGDQDIYWDVPGKNVITRYLANGTIDTSFANRGSIKKDGHNIAGILLQKDYKIVTLENLLNEPNPDTAYFYLYRYRNDVQTTKPIAQPENAIAKNISSINISPNPAQGTLNVTGLKSNSKLLIINESGKAVAEANISSTTFSWNIQNLPTGSYFLVESQNNKLIGSIKFIKQ